MHCNYWTMPVHLSVNIFKGGKIFLSCQIFYRNVRTKHISPSLIVSALVPLPSWSPISSSQSIEYVLTFWDTQDDFFWCVKPTLTFCFVLLSAEIWDNYHISRGTHLLSLIVIFFLAILLQNHNLQDHYSMVYGMFA